jgi:hypothetical protein
MEQHPEIRKQLSTWTKAVFLMLEVKAGEKGSMLAVSCSQSIPGPPADAHLPAAEMRQWTSLAAAAALPDMPHVRVQHWDGGPLGRSQPLAVAHVHEAADPLPRGVKRAPPAWLWGPFDAVAAVAEKTAGASRDKSIIVVNVVWGYAGWGGTQILAEIGRGGWGITPLPDYLALRPDASLPVDWALDFEWSRIVPVTKLPPPSEYKRGKKR